MIWWISLEFQAAVLIEVLSFRFMPELAGSHITTVANFLPAFASPGKMLPIFALNPITFSSVFTAPALEFLVVIPFEWAVTASLWAMIVDGKEFLPVVDSTRLPLFLPAVEVIPAVTVISPAVYVCKGVSTASVTGLRAKISDILKVLLAVSNRAIFRLVAVVTSPVITSVTAEILEGIIIYAAITARHRAHLSDFCQLFTCVDERIPCILVAAVAHPVLAHVASSVDVVVIVHAAGVPFFHVPVLLPGGPIFVFPVPFLVGECVSGNSCNNESLHIS